jgi:hypothetical protein
MNEMVTGVFHHRIFIFDTTFHICFLFTFYFPFPCFQSLRNRIEALECQLEAGWGAILEKPDRRNGVNLHEKENNDEKHDEKINSKNEKLNDNFSDHNNDNNMSSKKCTINQDEKSVINEDHDENKNNNNCIKNEDLSQANIEPNNKQRKGRYGKKVKKEDNSDSSRPGKRGKTSFQFDGETVNLMHFLCICSCFILLFCNVLKRFLLNRFIYFISCFTFFYIFLFFFFFDYFRTLDY